MLVQIDVFYTHSLTVDYHASWYFLYQIVHDVNLIDKSIHLRSKSHNLRDAMSVVLILQYGSWKLLVKVKEWWERKELAFVQFVFVIVHELPTESCSISSTFHMCFWAHCSRNRWWCVWTCPKWQIQWKIVSPLFIAVFQLVQITFRNIWWFLRSCQIHASGWLLHIHFRWWQTSLAFLSIQSPRIWNMLSLLITCTGSPPQ